MGLRIRLLLLKMESSSSIHLVINGQFSMKENGGSELFQRLRPVQRRQQPRVHLPRLLQQVRPRVLPRVVQRPLQLPRLCRLDKYNSLY